MFNFLKSTRSIAATIIVITISIGLFLGKITAEQYMQVAMLIVGAYFAKRDNDEDRGNKPQI
jgi:hypothetical protein